MEMQHGIFDKMFEQLIVNYLPYVITILIGIVWRLIEKNFVKKNLNAKWNTVIDQIQDRLEEFQNKHVDQVDVDRMKVIVKQAVIDNINKPENKNGTHT